MPIKKFRWSNVYESPEEELVAFLKARSINSNRVVAEASTECESQIHDKDTTIWCAEGSLTVDSGVGRTSLQPGDALRISSQTTYTLRAGLTGYVCYISE